MTDGQDSMDALRLLVDPQDDIDIVETCRSKLMERILILNEYAWERRLDQGHIDRWLSNFNGSAGYSTDEEQLHALYILSQFMYFGIREIRVLLKSLYRDLYLVPAIQRVRGEHNNSEDLAIIENGLTQEARQTRFLGIGNPSESGVHLLYYFRQENKLSKHQFADAASMFQLDQNGDIAVRDENIKRYIFLDDVCGSGETAIAYSTNFLNKLKSRYGEIVFEYHAVFGTASGIGEVRKNSVFGDQAKCVFELDLSYKSLSPESRNMKACPEPIKPEIISRVAMFYGDLVAPGNGGGFNDDQLLLGFSHNIPDNTLPIIWRDGSNGAPIKWTAAFKRYMKV